MVSFQPAPPLSEVGASEGPRGAGDRSARGAAVPFAQILGLRRSGPEPLYYQLAVGLERAIESGQVPHGTRLPPEPEMAHELRLAVGTVRRAWAYLERKGTLTRIRKAGTFIR